MNQTPTNVFSDLPDGTKLYIRRWAPDAPKGTILVAHGLGETADYYDEFSARAANRGFGVIVPELRGHGRTAGDIASPSYRLRGGNPGPDSLHKMAEDLIRIGERQREAHPEKPLFLLGHSMGSVAAQLAVFRQGELFDGLLLAGVPAGENAAELQTAVREEISNRGLKAVCVDTFQALFGRANDPFEPTRTPLDWITSDEELVDQSLALPYTSVLFTNEFYRDFLGALIETQAAESWRDTPRELPVLLVLGGDDVMDRDGKGTLRKQEILEGLGFSDVSSNIYPNLRHSILRERSRSRVIEDLLHWIELRLKLRMCSGVS